MSASGIINEFRTQHGRPPYYFWNPIENDHCHEHCWAMVCHGMHHAPGHFLHGKSEAVGVHSWTNDFTETLSRLIFDCMGNSHGHRSVLLMNNLAYSVIVHDGAVYLTVRGWD
jgi:hypothetical protein